MNPNLDRHPLCGLRLALLAALVVASLAPARTGAAVETGFIKAKVEADGQSMPYVVYVPPVTPRSGSGR